MDYFLKQADDLSNDALSEFLGEYGCRMDKNGIGIVFSKSDCLRVSFDGVLAHIGYEYVSEAFRAVAILIDRYDGKPFEYAEKRRLRVLSFMADNSRNAVLNVLSVKRLVRMLAACGYNELQLYTEDTYEIDGEPYFGYLRGRYTKDELIEIDSYADSYGIEVVPCIQTLAHLNAIARWDEYGDVIDCNDILLAGEEKTYALIDKMFASYADSLKSRKINIGMDEAHMVGLGKYLKKHGYHNRFDIMNEHLRRVMELAKKYGYRPAMWSDMYFRLAFAGEYHYIDKEIPLDITKSVPEGIDLIYWDYDHLDEHFYAKMIDQHKRFKQNKTVVAGGVWKWIGFAPDNRYSTAASKALISACIDRGIDDFVLTAWGDDGAECSVFAALPTIAACAEYAYGQFDDDTVNRGFVRVTGCNRSEFIAVDFPNRQLYEDNPSDKNNSSRYLLYNDCFLGIFDCFAEQTNREIMTKNLARIQAAKNKCGQFAYIFDTLESLQEVNLIKATLGLETRRAYQEKDRLALTELLKRYSACITAVEKLYSAFKKQWMKENKPQGFEVQDLRLGGLIRRITHCAERLEDFLSGTLLAIPELEQDTLPLPKDAKIQSYVFQSHAKNISAGIV